MPAALAPTAAALEELLRELYSKVLGIGRAWPCDDFFALGGSSLAARRLVERLERLTGIDLPFS
ncbi:MAG: phosphopantetheine-binding protein, partial [Acidobacteriota bacterium]|nr:phosphopantetheine-binding protein [Acidobacteriota bacterium]